jgi:hypothetical protein
MGSALPYPKQFIPVNGEPIIARTLRLLRELGVEDFPYIVIPKGQSELYTFEGTATIELPETPFGGLLFNIDRAVRSSRHQEPVTVLLGDVCWSKRALEQTLDVPAEWEPCIVGRFTGSEVTGKPWDERFAVIARPEFFARHADAINLKLLSLTAELSGMNRLSISPTDYTDDIDFPHELEHILPNLMRLAREEG